MSSLREVPHYSASTDIYAAILLADGRSYRLGNIQQIVYSKHRDKFPVGGIGSSGPRGFTAGHRSIQGSLTFSSFDRAAFYGIVPAASSVAAGMWQPGQDRDVAADSMCRFADQLPPFDVLVVLTDDRGNTSVTVFFGIVLHGEGMSMGVDDIETFQSYQYSAMGIEGPINITDRITQPAAKPSDTNLPSKVSFRSNLDVSTIGGISTL